jgi:hypothetical protein
MDKEKEEGVLGTIADAAKTSMDAAKKEYLAPRLASLRP